MRGSRRCCFRQRDFLTSLEILLASSQPFASHGQGEQRRQKPAVPSSHLLPTCKVSMKTHTGSGLKELPPLPLCGPSFWVATLLFGLRPLFWGCVPSFWDASPCLPPHRHRLRRPFGPCVDEGKNLRSRWFTPLPQTNKGIFIWNVPSFPSPSSLPSPSLHEEIPRFWRRNDGPRTFPHRPAIPWRVRTSHPGIAQSRAGGCRLPPPLTTPGAGPGSPLPTHPLPQIKQI